MRNRRGITLMELIIMIAVGGILLVGLSRSANVLIKQQVDARNMLIALNIAKWQMAKINNLDYASIPAAPAAEAVLTADPAFPDFIPTWQIASVATSGGNTLKLITVRVREKSISGAIFIRLDTYRTNIVTFGNGT